MSSIPSKCPKCGSVKQWEEEVRPLTSGIPVGGGAVRIRFLSVRGLFARSIKEKLGFYRVTYRCHKCGFRKEYDIGE